MARMKWENLHKIVVSGSRGFKYKDNATAWLDKHIRKFMRTNEVEKDDIVIITGGGLGVDAAVEVYCIRAGIKNLICHARWTELEPSNEGKNPAGVIRNRHMIQLGDELVAFWDGTSRGTKNAIRNAEKYGLPLTVVLEKDVRPTIIKVPRIKGHTVTKQKVEANKKLGKRMRNIFADADIKSWKKELKRASSPSKR